MDEFAALEVRIDANASRFERNLKRTERTLQRSTNRMGRDVARIDDRFARFGARFGASMRGLLPALGVASTVRGLDRTVTALDNIGKTASKLGVTTDALQELRFAAEQSGVGVRTTDMALQRFSRRLAEARQGGGEAKAALEQMNIALSDATGAARPVEDVLRDVADAMVKLDSDGERLRVAFKLFDSEGAALVNMLKDGSGALDDMREAAREAGAVIDQKALRAAEDLRGEIDRLASSIGGGLLQAFGKVNIAFNEFLNIGSENMMSNLQGEIDETRAKIDRMKESMSSESMGGPFGELEMATLESYQSKLLGLLDKKRELEAASAPAPLIEPSTSGGGGGGSSAVREQSDAYGEMILKMQELQFAMQDELELVGLTGAALERKKVAQQKYRLETELLAAAEKDGIEGDKERLALIREATGAYEELALKVVDAEEAERLRTEALKDSAKAAEDARRGIERIGDSLTNAIQNATSFSDALRSVALQLANIGIQGLAGAGPLGDVLGGAIPGLFGSSAAPSTSPTPMIRPRALGGPVSAGSPYLVGERGPEIVVPRAAGTVIPNNKLGGRAISVTLNVDARGSSDPAAIQAAVSQSSAAILAAVPEAVRQAVRGGRL